jgi:nickel/cobalt exporter
MRSRRRPRRLRRATGGVALSLGILVLSAGPVGAHPMGNFTVNTAAALRVGRDHVVVDVAVDLAEIPTLQAKPGIDTNGDDALQPAELDTYLRSECARFATGTTITADGVDLKVAAVPGNITAVEGLASLMTLRFTCTLTAADAHLSDGRHEVTYSSDYAASRVGWHEVTARGDQMLIEQSDVAETSPSAGLTAYPTAIGSPPNVRTAKLTVKPGGPALGPVTATSAPGSSVGSAIPGVDRATKRFADLVSSHDLTVRIGFLAVLIAFVLGIFHAVAPGHGKTVMAAYLVGQNGSLRQALGIGASVTLTHTAGVLVLGLLLSASTVATPERLYPWLGAISGMMLASIGMALLLRAWRMRRLGLAGIWHSHAPGAAGHVHTVPQSRRRPKPAALPATQLHTHEHYPSSPARRTTAGVATATATATFAPSRVHLHDFVQVHDHEHGTHGHDDHDHAAPEEALDGNDQSIGWKWIIAMGFAGGMVPSPSALLVLLGAVALGRTWFGVSLVIAYGTGMAVTLIAAGLLLVRARQHIETVVEHAKTQRLIRVMRYLPLLTAIVIVGGGLLVTARALRAL